MIAPEGLTTADVVASNVRAEAARLGFSQVALGRALGISQGSITKKWRGVRAWQLDELDDVARVLGVSVVDLVRPQGGLTKGGAPADDLDEGTTGRPRGTRTPNPRIKSPLLYH